MTRHDETTRLRHMLDFARQAERICGTRSREDLDQDELFPLAPARLIELVGEAARSISEERQAKMEAVPGRDIVSARNSLIHSYPNINLDRLWDIAQDGLPPLISELERELNSE